MEPSKQTEPITLNYACGRHTRRFPPLEKTLAVLLVIIVSVFVIDFIRPRFVSGPSESVPLARANMDSLTSPLGLYHQHVGAYPTSLADLYQLPPGMTQKTWRGPYIDSPSNLKDAWGNEFRYKTPGIHNAGQYDLWSIGKDGVSGTKDDICNWP